jgi:hypothetical protein
VHASPEKGLRILNPDGSAMLVSVASPIERREVARGTREFAAVFAANTIAYAEAKTAYCQALRAAMPELINIATGRQARPPELDNFATAFALAGEKQEMVADQKTMIFLKRFLPNPDVEKARRHATTSPSARISPAKRRFLPRPPKAFHVQCQSPDHHPHR